MQKNSKKIFKTLVLIVTSLTFFCIYAPASKKLPKELTAATVAVAPVNTDQETIVSEKKPKKRSRNRKKALSPSAKLDMKWKTLLAKLPKDALDTPLAYLESSCKNPLKFDSSLPGISSIIRSIFSAHKNIIQAKLAPLKYKEDSPWAYDENIIQQNFDAWIEKLKLFMLEAIKDVPTANEIIIITIIELISKKQIIEMSDEEIKKPQKILDCLLNNVLKLFAQLRKEKQITQDYWQKALEIPEFESRPSKAVMDMIKERSHQISPEDKAARQHILNALMNIPSVHRRFGRGRSSDEPEAARSTVAARNVQPATKKWTTFITNVHKLLKTPDSPTFLKYLVQRERFSDSAHIDDLLVLYFFLVELQFITNDLFGHANYQEVELVNSFDTWLNYLKTKIQNQKNPSRYMQILAVLIDSSLTLPLEDFKKIAHQLEYDTFIKLREFIEINGLISEEMIKKSFEFIGDTYKALEFLTKPKKKKSSKSGEFPQAEGAYWSKDAFGLLKMSPTRRKELYLMSSRKALNQAEKEKHDLYQAGLIKGVFPGKAHVMEGEVEKKRLGGGHSALFLGKGASIINKKAPNQWGAYSADIKLKGGIKKNNSMFPDSWDQETIEKKIYEASLNRISQIEPSDENFKYTGLTFQGMPIVIIENEKSRIITAYPEIKKIK